jgi:hypothetical protein
MITRGVREPQFANGVWYTEATGRSPTNRHPPHLPQAITLPPPAYFLIFPSSRLNILFTGMLVVIT